MTSATPGSKAPFAGETAPIGTSGLIGGCRYGLVFVGGPCGGSHTLSLGAARELRDWLTGVLEGAPHAEEIQHDVG